MNMIAKEKADAVFVEAPETKDEMKEIDKTQ